MSADVQHEFWVEPPVLRMTNNDDGYYIQTFKNWGEVESFIAKMRLKAEEAFGPEGE